MQLSEIFKAYDVRGTYPQQLNEEAAYFIGKAFATLVKSPAIIVGYDMRLSSPKLFAAFAHGATEMGADVIDIGQVCTDATYFAAGKLNMPAVMFTASHNPPQYNGLKFSKAGAVPINQDTGLLAIKEIIQKNLFVPVAAKKGAILKKDVLGEYVEHVLSFIDTSSLGKLKIAADAGNGMAGKIVPLVYRGLPIEIVPLYFALDGNFPNHLADPSKSENLRELQKVVRQEKCDFGMAFDGDADRIFFVDENGGIIHSSLISALVIQTLLKKNKGAAVIHNAVCGHIVPDTIRKNGGTVVIERVGHSFIKETMRKTNAIFACEHSAHYYYRDNYRADSGIITSLILGEIVSKEKKKLSELLAAFKKYATMEESSVAVKDKDAKIAEIEKIYLQNKPISVSKLDGLTVDFGSWWFNVRPSNTEPLLRLNLEAASEKVMTEKKKELLALLSS